MVTRTVRTAALLLVLVSAFSFAPQAVAAPVEPCAQEQQTPGPLPGHWSGSIEPVGLAFHMDLWFAGEDGSGGLTGTISIPVQGIADRPLVDPRWERVDGVATFTAGIEGIDGEPRFEGTRAADGTTIAGTFTQSGRTLSFSMAIGISADVALAGFDEWANDQLKKLRVPGMAVAVVFRGEVVHAAGYGLRDVAADLPADADTLFAIGSTTKAFTTFGIEQAVAEGLLDWDEPVRTYLPTLRLVDPLAEQQLTLRDMCSHRSGLPRHDLVWYANPDLTREEMLGRLAHLEPTVGFREAWQYNNLMYATAGLALERVSGDSWEDWTRAHILEPLGMTRTRFGLAETLATDNHALPHDRKRGKFVAIDMRDLTWIGPAGSIHSSANDMARWITLWLGGGEIEGERLLSQPQLANLIQPVTTFGGITPASEGPTAYALGWMVDSHEGHLRVHHGGGIDGFTTQVELYPADELGIFTVTNRASALTNIAASQLAERFLGLPPVDRTDFAVSQLDTADEMRASLRSMAAAERVPDAPAARPIASYAGRYRHPGYGDVVIELVDAADAADAQVLGLRYGILDVPLEHWHYEVFRCTEVDGMELAEGLMVHFRDDRDGYVAALEIQLESTPEPVILERQPDAVLLDPEYLDTLVGRYALLGQMLTVARGKGGAPLTLKVPGQPTYDLEPGTHGRFALADMDGFTVRFDAAEGDAPAALVLFQPNGTFRAEKVVAEEEEDAGSE
ncbi:D-alanyl-D-alanine carboxypeptidase precursor [Planctomycetes bacterium Pla163]|uniref:D-alanyl-D-alanine carboxypeptidase n=1 Tax=Rohdeia mirabilis TaxID=2528008 RepID=A0A518CVS1_9BACT|nr:D-alanyl-D-alanine carboxypeptidase precursor [Planctomycetes bacterium Pla163]